MNIQELHKSEKAVSALPLFKAEESTTIALQIQENEVLKEHITKVPALLVCIDGVAIFENEKGVKEKLSTGDYVNIEAMVKHKVTAVLTSNLILIK